MEIIRSSSGAQPLNPDVDYEYLGYGTNGEGTSISSGVSGNAKGAWYSLGTLSNNLCEFDLIFSSNTASGNRIVCDLGVGPNSGAVTVVAPDLYVVTSQMGATHAGDVVTLPLKLAAGQEVWARTAAQVGNVSQLISLRGVIASGSLPPGFDHCEVAHGNGAQVRAGSISVPTSGPPYTTIVTNSSRAYGALLCTLGQSTTTASNMEVGVSWATVVSGSAIDFFRSKATVSVNNPIFKTGGDRRLVRRSFAANTRFAVAARSGTTTETIFVGLHGFWS